MATMVGSLKDSDPFARDREYPKKGTLLQPALDMGPQHSGAPFDTSKPVPFTVIEGDPQKGGSVTEITKEAIDLIVSTNRSDSGLRTAETITDAAEAVRRTQEFKPVPVAEKPLRPSRFVRQAVPEQAPMSFPNHSHLDRDANQEAPEVAQQRPRTAVKFKGRFGTLTAPYDEIFVDDVSLVLVQMSSDGIHYEPPQDYEELITISWNKTVAVCHSCVHYKMPDGKSAHTVYLISEDGVSDDQD